MCAARWCLLPAELECRPKKTHLQQSEKLKPKSLSSWDLLQERSSNLKTRRRLQMHRRTGLWGIPSGKGWWCGRGTATRRASTALRTLRACRPLRRRTRRGCWLATKAPSKQERLSALWMHSVQEGLQERFWMSRWVTDTMPFPLAEVDPLQLP